MNIAFVIPTLLPGGAERVASVLANEWALNGHSVSLILLARHRPFYKIHSAIQIHNLGFHYSFFLQKPLMETITLCKLRRLFKNLNPDCVICFMDKFNVFCLIAGFGLPYPIFVSDRSSPSVQMSFPLRFLRRLLYPLAAGIIAQTISARQSIANCIKNDNVFVLPNPIKEIKDFPNLPKEKIILNIGRLVPEKGQKYLIEAFSLLEAPGWSLKIVGEGPLKGQLLDQINALGLGDRVHLTGNLQDVDECLAQSEIFAFSSISEGFPNALCEAMAAGLPCVSFDCQSGPNEIIKHEINGLLVPVYDIEAFADALSFLISDVEKRRVLGKESIKIREKLGSHKVAQLWINELDKAKQSL